jgi:hypothetical protein
MTKNNKGTLVVIVLIVIFLFYVAPKLSNQAILPSSDFPSTDAPTKTTLDKNIKMSYTETSGWNGLSFDDSSWQSISVPFNSVTETWSSTTSGRCCYGTNYPAFSSNANCGYVWYHSQVAAAPSNCIEGTISNSVQNGCSCTGYGLNTVCGHCQSCGTYSETISCQLPSSGGWDLNQNSIYLRKTFSVPTASQGVWVKIVPSGFPDKSSGLDSSTYNQYMYTLSEGSTKGTCYVNGQAVSMSSIATQNHRYNNWGMNVFAPYVDVSSLIIKGSSNVIACKLNKNAWQAGDFNFDIVVYGSSKCMSFKSSESVGETLPENIDWQNGMAERFEMHWLTCDFGNYEVYHTTSKTVSDPASSYGALYPFSGSFYGDANGFRLEEDVPANANLRSAYPESYILFNNTKSIMFDFEKQGVRGSVFIDGTKIDLDDNIATVAITTSSIKFTYPNGDSTIRSISSPVKIRAEIPVYSTASSFIMQVTNIRDLIVLGDTTGDGFINNQELLAVISSWTNNQYTNPQLLDVISVWVNSP